MKGKSGGEGRMQPGRPYARRPARVEPILDPQPPPRTRNPTSIAQKDCTASRGTTSLPRSGWYTDRNVAAMSCSLGSGRMLCEIGIPTISGGILALRATFRLCSP